MDLGPVNTRSKAAAWAWYQHTSGSVTLRSEVALAARPYRRSASGCPSRFKIEADLQLLSPPSAPIRGTSDIRLESLRLSKGSSCSEAAIDTIGDVSPAPSRTLLQEIDGCMDQFVIAAPSSSYNAAAWDCGSTLFDSFELVAMAKKLDNAHQLNQAAMEKVCLDTSARDAKSVALPSLLMNMKDMHRLISKESSTAQLSSDQMQSRQAIYDMFCRYDNPAAREEISLSEDLNPSNHEHMRKPHIPAAMLPVARTKQHRRRRIHSFSSALRQHIAHLAGHSRASSTAHRPPDRPRLHHFLSLPAEAPAQQQCQSPSLPTESTVHSHLHSHRTAGAASPSCKSSSSPSRICVPSPHKNVHADRSARVGIKSMGSRPFRECPPFEGFNGVKACSHTLGKQYTSESVDHHYHHHYHHHHHHYLFQQHLNEGLEAASPEPFLGVDKSLLVAAARLRMAKNSSLQDYLSTNPKLQGALSDYKCNLKDANLQSTTASPIRSPSPPPPSLQF